MPTVEGLEAGGCWAGTVGGLRPSEALLSLYQLEPGSKWGQKPRVPPAWRMSRQAWDPHRWREVRGDISEERG